MTVDIDARGNVVGFDIDRASDRLSTPEGPVTLSGIEGVFLDSSLTRHRFVPHSSIDGAYWLQSEGLDRPVTFKPSVFDRHASSVELLTYGNPTFDSLLEEVADIRYDDQGNIASDTVGAAMLLRDRERPPVAVCVAKGIGELEEIGTMSEYQKAALGQAASWSAEDRERALGVLRRARERTQLEASAAAQEILEAKRRGLREEARHILIRAAHIMDIQEDLFTSSGRDVMQQLRRRGVPYPGLVSLLSGDRLRLSLTDRYRVDLEGKKAATLTQLLGRLKQEGMEVLRRYAEVSQHS